MACLGTAHGQVTQGFGISLREDLVDFSTMSVDGYTHNPYGTAYRHTFGTKLSAGYCLEIDSRWRFGIAAGLILHDYSLTGIFHSWDEPANTTDDGLFTECYDELTVNPVTNTYGLTPVTDRMWQTTRFDRQGFFWSLGIGDRCGHFDLEPEYTCQPRHYVTDTRQESVDGTGTLLSATGNHSGNHLDNSDGLTLRLTYRF